MHRFRSPLLVLLLLAFVSSACGADTIYSSYQTRKSSVSEDNATGQLKLAEWCIRVKLTAAALDHLRLAAKSEDTTLLSDVIHCAAKNGWHDLSVATAARACKMKPRSSILKAMHESAVSLQALDKAIHKCKRSEAEVKETHKNARAMIVRLEAQLRSGKETRIEKRKIPLTKCPSCDGSGRSERRSIIPSLQRRGQVTEIVEDVPCLKCDGTGKFGGQTVLVTVSRDLTDEEMDALHRKQLAEAERVKTTSVAARRLANRRKSLEKYRKDTAQCLLLEKSPPAVPKELLTPTADESDKPKNAETKAEAKEESETSTETKSE